MSFMSHTTHTEHPRTIQSSIRTLLSRKPKPGFTFMELILVIGILGALMFGIGLAIKRNQERANLGLAKAGLRRIQESINFYHTDTDQYPPALGELMNNTANIKNWHGKYIEDSKELVDPWKNKYQYTLTPEGSEHPYELFSYGRNGKKAPKSERISVWSDAK